MSYIHSVDLQELVYQLLSQDTDLAALVGTNIFDMPPEGDVPLTYVTLGPEEVSDQSDQSAKSAVHMITVSVVTRESGFHEAKTVAQAVSQILDEASVEFTQGCLTRMQFKKARARRIDGGLARQIDLIFRARVDD